MIKANEDEGGKGGRLHIISYEGFSFGGEDRWWEGLVGFPSLSSLRFFTLCLDGIHKIKDD